jgi:hypothetical protein
MERADLHVMFYYYSACLHLGKTKGNFRRNILGFIRVIMCPTELKMQPTIHFRVSEKSWLLKLKYPAFFGNG